MDQLPHYEMNTTVDITNMRKEAVVEALYNGSVPCGMGILASRPSEYTREQARKELLEQMKYESILYIDYLHGKRMKLHIDKDVVDIRRYNSGAYQDGLGQRILEELKKDPTAFYASEAEMHADPIWRFCHPSPVAKIVVQTSSLWRRAMFVAVPLALAIALYVYI